MENSAQKAGFAIAAMIVVIVAAGVAVDWWDSYHQTNGAAVTETPNAVSAEKRFAEEIQRLKFENEDLRWKNDELKRQLQAAGKKELEPFPKEPAPLKPEEEPIKAEPARENVPLSGN